MADADIVTLKQRRPIAVKPRLRFDKGVVQLIGRLQAGLEAVVPDDRTVVITCTAPIRLVVKTADALAGLIRAALDRDARRDLAYTINDNAIRVRFVRTQVRGGAPVIAFVHNPRPARRRDAPRRDRGADRSACRGAREA